ncbi:ribosome recycling factor [Candidatus Peregrinibacteria bacterium]|nr:ribosome recycling factor [Candidatus Peregrinibacteria bacterium]
MSISSFLTDSEKEFQKILNHLKEEYSRLNIGRANAALVEGILVEAYGSRQPLKAVASIMVTDARTITLQPWDKNVLVSILKSIQTSELNLNPSDDGSTIRIPIPALTQERRQELVKVVHKFAEEARISVRHARQHVLTAMKKLEQDKKIGENEYFGGEKKMQEKVDAVNEVILELAKSKEKDIMTV